MTLKHRLTQLEKQRPPMMSNDELAERINRVLANPHLVAQAAYNRIVQLLNLARERKAHHEQPTQQG
jgi:hypothetical protein